MKVVVNILLGALVSLSFMNARQTDVLMQIQKVKASASSSIPGSPASNIVDGSGMKGNYHIASGTGEGMWVSDVSSSEVRYSASTHQGKAWVMCEIGDDGPVSVDQIRIWNHNQSEHMRRGFAQTFVEYSSDGVNWKLLKDGENDFHLIPASPGRDMQTADYVIDTDGIKMRYVCFTAADNHYDMSDSVVARETADMNQNPDYYGLSEIRFYVKEKMDDKQLPVPQNMELSASQGYLRTENGPAREFRLAFDKPLYSGADLEFECNGEIWKDRLDADAYGAVEYNGKFPCGYMEEESSLSVRMNFRGGSMTGKFDVPAARKWVVCFLPHSHLDIGYTHRQYDVMKLQWRNFERAMELAERTKDYPDGARFKWNTEATWCVDGYLDEYAGTEKASRFIDAVRDSVINVDASLGSILSGISRQEELMHYFDDAHDIERITGVDCNTAMMSDVPGQVWGLSTAMSKNGIEYYSPGPNYVPFYGKIGNDRAAAIHIRWGDRPFYWQSQSGTDKVLVWSAGRGYSWFHGWLAGRLSVCGTEPIWQYLTELELDEFPYRMCYLRYTVHGDNGPPDELMPDTIKEWNEKYESPQFRICTTKEFFERFEQEYGDVIPVYGGDMTPTWEDGAASTARETSMNRETSSRLAQTSILWNMLRPDSDYPEEKFNEAWKNVVLFSEHTWGAAGSGPEPYSDFTIDLWNGKKAFADSAYRQSMSLYEDALSPLSGQGRYIHVLNTNLWTRTDMVTVTSDLTGKILHDRQGNIVPVQKLHDGSWAFIAEDVPAMSSAVYTVSSEKKGNSVGEYLPMVSGNVLDNGIIRVEIDPERGTIVSLRTVDDDYEYASGAGLNEYMYSDHLSDSNRGIDKVTGFEITDNGAVRATVRITSEAPGCRSLTNDISIYRGLDRIDIVNVIDKEGILEKENVRFVFPFNFSQPEISMDLAMSEIHPEREQLSGVNKNYYSVMNGLSVGDLEHGICLTTIDAPFVELGTPSGLDYKKNPHYGYGWWPSAQISPVIYSWVMTNTWGTNYKASQEGKAVFRYSLKPENPHDLKLKQIGLEREQQLVTVNSSVDVPVGQMFRLSGRHRISLSGIRKTTEGNGYILSLQNMGTEPVNTGFVWGTMKGVKVSTCDWQGNPEKELDAASFWLQPYEYKTVRVDLR